MTTRTAFVLAAVLAVGLVFAVHALDFPGSVPRFEKLSGGGVLLLSCRFSFRWRFWLSGLYERGSWLMLSHPRSH
jgi:hypothetical protein